MALWISRPQRMKLRQHNVKQLQAAFKLLKAPDRADQRVQIQVPSVESRIEESYADTGGGFEDMEGVVEEPTTPPLTFTFIARPYSYSAFPGDSEKIHLEWELIR